MCSSVLEWSKLSSTENYTEKKMNVNDWPQSYMMHIVLREIWEFTEAKINLVEAKKKKNRQREAQKKTIYHVNCQNQNLR